METTARGGELDSSVGNFSNDYKNSVGDVSFYRRGIGFILLLSALTLSACGTPLDLCREDFNQQCIEIMKKINQKV